MSGVFLVEKEGLVPSTKWKNINLGRGWVFGETLITAGSTTNPKGAVAMIGPSDLDTDTRFNNTLCGRVWDELIEGRISELAPLLHAGKQSVLTEFENLVVLRTFSKGFGVGLWNRLLAL